MSVKATVDRSVTALGVVPYVASPVSYRITRRDDGSNPTHVTQGKKVVRWSKSAHRKAQWGTRA